MPNLNMARQGEYGKHCRLQQEQGLCNEHYFAPLKTISRHAPSQSQ